MNLETSTCGRTPISQDRLRRLQLIQLKIAVEVTDLCDRHGIRYVLLGGSALGARRHAGFIPWDDDMDMGMLRRDFDHFIAVGRRELPAHLYVQYWLDDPHMGASFAKVRLNDTCILEATSSETGGHKGISIDIFPFDNVPAGPLAIIWKFRLKFWKRLLRHKSGYTIRKLPMAARVVDFPVRAFTPLISLHAAKRRMHRLMTRYSGRSAQRVLAVGGAYDFHKDMLARRWLTDRKRLPFENCLLYCPEDIDAYLAHMYGDFMKLPPEQERRNKHHILELNFGSNEEPQSP